MSFDEATQQVHILGRAPGGEEGWTVYVVEPHANAVYADARIGDHPTAWAMDGNGIYPAEDRQQLLALSADGTVSSVEVGSHAFAWRLPGVIAGTLMALLLYVLARMLFQRRAVAVVLGVLLAADGMLFVQSRIAMNDAYVGLFIVAAYTLFAALWTGVWKRAAAFWLLMPVVGLLLGLVWPYLTLSALGMGPGALIAGIGAAALVVSGILALVIDRHAEASRPV